MVGSGGIKPAAAPGAAVALLAASEQRREERVAVQAPLTMSTRGASVVAEMRDLSLNGAFVAISGKVGLPVGTGLRLEFTLPQGFRINVSGRIVWARQVADAHGPPGYGIHFFAVDAINREFLEYHLNLAKKGEAGQVKDGRVFTRFVVEPAGRDRLRVHMSGSLTPDECEGLEDTVCRALAHVGHELFVYIDVTELGACSKVSLDHIRSWFARLRYNDRQLAGVLVGGSSLGVVQMRRLAREAGIADALVSFAAEADAERFWRELLTAGRGPA